MVLMKNIWTKVQRGAKISFLGCPQRVLTAERSKHGSKTGGNTDRNDGIDGKNGDINNDSGARRALKRAGGLVLTTGLISGAVIGGTTLLLPAVGFGALGPIAGSMAAAYQSSVGIVAAGSVFSTLQSVGMVGLSVTAKSGIVAGSAFVSTVISKSKSNDEK